jgi:hypothetical protein
MNNCPKCKSELYYAGNVSSNGICKYQCNCSVSTNGDLTCILEEDSNDKILTMTLFMDLSVGYLGYSYNHDSAPAAQINLFYEGQQILLEDNKIRTLQEAWELLSRFKSLMVFS